MKVCFIIEYYYPHVGGAEVLFQCLAEGLVRAGHTCDVVTCRLPDTEKREVINGVNIHRIWVPELADRYWFTFLSLFSAWKVARKAEMIHTVTYNGAFSAWLISKLQKLHVIISVLEVIGKRWHKIGMSPIVAFLYKTVENLLLYLPFDAYSCISKSTMKSLEDRNISPKRLFLAYPGIDYSLFDPQRDGKSKNEIRDGLGLKEGAFLYTYYGRPGYVKGVEYLVKAVPYVKGKIPGSRLLLILSRKPERGYKRVLELIRELGLKRGEDIIVIDPVSRDELPYYIQASDCVVVPSLSEGFGFTCVEACTMKIPVVATDAGSLPEVIFGRYILVGQGNPLALAHGIERVYHNEYTISEDKVFLWEDTVRNCTKMYESLIEP